jgi:acyl carrier protein
MSVETQIREFISEEILEGLETETGDPLAEGLLDSLAVEQLIAFVEEEYAVVFEDEELVAENFASIPTVAGIVEAKRRLAG